MEMTFWQKVSHYLVNKLTGRKFQAFLLASVALFTGNLSEDVWMIICISYMGVEGAIDAIGRMKGGPPSGPVVPTP